MKNTYRVVTFVLFVVVLNPAVAYELRTHSRLTAKSYAQSVLSDKDILKIYGLETNQNLGTSYFGDIPKLQPILYANQFENEHMSDFTLDNQHSPQAWMARGAIREDDNSYEAIFGDQPFTWDQARVRFHFYDPYNNRALKLASYDARWSAVDWALGTSKAFEFPHLFDPSHESRYSIAEAREAMYGALTSNNERKRYWATTFRILGDVVHLLQDMAQPQHVRNDYHGPGDFSLYEKYIEALADEDNVYEVDIDLPGANLPKWKPLDYGNGTYPVPHFTRYSDFFSVQREQIVESRNGLADFTNRNYFSVGTNINRTSDNYPMPIKDPDAYGSTIVHFGDDYELKYLTGSIVDNLGPSAVNNKQSRRYEIFNTSSIARVFYGLDLKIHDDSAAQLLPRAIAYSTGLIDYFFRGQLKAENVSIADNGKQISMYIRNVTQYNEAGQENKETLYYYNYNGDKGKYIIVANFSVGDFEYSITSDEVTFEHPENIEPGHAAEQRLTFTMRYSVPSDAKNIEWRVIFRGALGQEYNAIAVGSFGASEGFFYQNGKHIYQQNNQWLKSEETGPSFTVVDWKGAYVGGKATKVLAWRGPSNRYFAFNRFNNRIYQNGMLLGEAPMPVLGAAITTDSEGKEWIIAVCKEGDADVIYRRAYIVNPAAGESNVDAQWQQLAYLTTPEGTMAADRAWFFNGDGTEAQTTRATSGSSTYSVTLVRLKLTLASPTISIVNENSGISTGTYNREYICSENSETGAISAVFDATTTSDTGEMIAAVDYDDATERLAKIVVNTSRRSIASGSGDSNGPERSSSSEVYDHHVKLVVGNLSLPFERTRHNYEDFATYPVSGSGSEVTQWDNLYLGFLDLRQGVIAYNLIEQSYDQQHSDNFSDQISHTEYSYVSRNLREAHMDKKDFVVDDYTETYAGDYTNSTTYPHYFGYDPSGGCRDLSDSYTAQSVIRVYLPSTTSPDSIATDRSGNTFASFRYREMATGTSRVFNYLTNDADISNDNSTHYFPISPK